MLAIFVLTVLEYIKKQKSETTEFHDENPFLGIDGFKCLLKESLNLEDIYFDFGVEYSKIKNILNECLSNEKYEEIFNNLGSEMEIEEIDQISNSYLTETKLYIFKRFYETDASFDNITEIQRFQEEESNLKIESLISELFLTCEKNGGKFRGVYTDKKNIEKRNLELENNRIESGELVPQRNPGVAMEINKEVKSKKEALLETEIQNRSKQEFREIQKDQKLKKEKKLGEERQREFERIEKFKIQEELEKQRELERKKELEKQRELERQRQEERQRELARHIELERQRELERQMELERQRKIEKQRELEREKERIRKKTFEEERRFEGFLIIANCEFQSNNEKTYYFSYFIYIDERVREMKNELGESYLEVLGEYNRKVHVITCEKKKSSSFPTIRPVLNKILSGDFDQCRNFAGYPFYKYKSKRAEFDVTNNKSLCFCFETYFRETRKGIFTYYRKKRIKYDLKFEIKWDGYTSYNVEWTEDKVTHAHIARRMDRNPIKKWVSRHQKIISSQVIPIKGEKEDSNVRDFFFKKNNYVTDSSEDLDHFKLDK